ncbi:hypothetical protein jaqu_11040 [Jannaschia aquimarina]|uniref:Uncharacterized protein n=1 Tax=Jannaschia aquimarina TaxID=935700 RepID=A0A0D1CQT8_9RHOB|nr:hypothetical protein jaqu_11040 [Jannaschia aquimarina]SNT29953.1 hypothetical protein SAMN05421775_110110 [Jannaschia aquimarina]
MKRDPDVAATDVHERQTSLRNARGTSGTDASGGDI